MTSDKDLTPENRHNADELRMLGSEIPCDFGHKVHNCAWHMACNDRRQNPSMGTL